ncbi:MAG: hypothetical protein WAM11_01925 [Cyanobium sp.]
MACFSAVRRLCGSAGPICRVLVPGLSLAALLSPLGLPIAALAPLRAQDLVGCQLVEGTLQCVPGITADPQQQIRILEGTIAADQKLEGAIEQGIAGLQHLELQGQAREGKLLRAVITADALAALPPSAFHWYRRTPGDSRWLLIVGASGPSYQLQAADTKAVVMVVVAVPGSSGSQRAASAPVGPVVPVSAP